MEKNDFNPEPMEVKKERAILGTMFLGPQAENADLVEKLITDVLRDHIFWRRNFHPEDTFVIREKDKRTEEYEENITRLFQSLYDLLRRLKRNNIPFSSPRYIGHMLDDQLITGIVGYFAAMLYNPNNVTEEASPETTDLEIEFGKELATLLGYKIYEMHKDPETLLKYHRDNAWGHICSGGTVANLEALWVARNLKYLPLTIRRVLEKPKSDELNEHKEKLEKLKEQVKIGNTPFTELTAWDLLNLSPSRTLDLRINILKASCEIGGEKFQNVVEKEILSLSLSTLGLHRFIVETQAEIFKETNRKENQIKPGVILVPSTRHYSLGKIAEILGLGRGEEELIPIPIRGNFRMNDEILGEALEYFLEQKIPVIAVISVCGSTEEAAIDPIDKIEDLRSKFEPKGLSFYHHCDAAYGGYILCIFNRDPDNNLTIPSKFTIKTKDKIDGWPSDDILKALEAINRVDSVTIDPHKLGYLPYPAGAVIFKDGRIKWEIAFNPGYLALPFIGSYIVEGSKPGAAAAACWLSTKVYPLNPSGFGVLLKKSIKSAHVLLGVLSELEEEINQELKDYFRGKHQPDHSEPIRLKVLNDPPDMNILCFVLNWEPWSSAQCLFQMNCFNEEIYKQLNFDKMKALGEHDFIVSYTKFKYSEYGSLKAKFITNSYENSMQGHLKEMSINPEDFKPNPNTYDSRDRRSCDDEIFVLRCTVMNPWLGETGIHNYASEFKKCLIQAIKNILDNPSSFHAKVGQKASKRG